jgi:hypothetical protein
LSAATSTSTSGCATETTRAPSAVTAASKPSATSGSSSPTRGETTTRRSGARSAGASMPASAASNGSQSATVRAIGPAWSSDRESGTTPRSGTRPRVGLIVAVPQTADGMRSEPAVSVPVAAGVMRAASAAAEPPLEPPAERSSAHGFATWSVVPPHANSCVCRCPSRTIPCARSRTHAVELRRGTTSSTSLDAVSCFPATA